MKYSSSFICRFIFKMLLSLWLSGCSTHQLQQAKDIDTPKGYKLMPAKQLTTNGQNYSPQFFDGNKQIVFISRDRFNHVQPQIYRLVLATSVEKRITFQDGEIFDIDFDPPTQTLYYSSSTDELKENPIYLQNLYEKNPKNRQNEEFTNTFGEKFGPAEIYSSTIEGRNIVRLTNSTGYDGQVTTQPKTHDLLFVTLKNSSSHLMQLRLKSKVFSPLLSYKSNDQIRDTTPQYSPDGKQLIWSRATPPGFHNEIWLASANGQNAKVLISGPGEYLEPKWHPNNQEIIFTSNRDDPLNYELYSAKADGSCIRRLTYNTALDRSPAFNSTGTKLVFRSDRNGHNPQIFMMDYSPPPCAEEVKAVGLKK